jgi:heme-degrading monooxygenase HmoA
VTASGSSGSSRHRPGGAADAYVDAAREGTLADRAAGTGPLALWLAVDRPDRFVTLSLWGDWAHVEAATGADVHRVDRTRHAERLAGWNAEHFEVIPGLAVIRSDPASQDR